MHHYVYMLKSQDSKPVTYVGYTNNIKKRYGFISTGNFNEDTASLYIDYTLFTSNQKILKEVNRIFNFLQVHYSIGIY